MPLTSDELASLKRIADALNRARKSAGSGRRGQGGQICREAVLRLLDELRDKTDDEIVRYFDRRPT